MPSWDEPAVSDDPFENDVQYDRTPTTRANMVSLSFRGIDGTRVAIPVANLAFEMAMFSEDLPRVAQAWGLKPDTLAATLRRTPLLQRMVDDYKKELEDNGRLRTQAKDLLTGALPKLQDIIFNAITAPKDIINAVELLAKLADALPKQTQAAVGTGTVLNFNITNRQAAAAAAAPTVFDGIAASAVDISFGETDQPFMLRKPFEEVSDDDDRQDS